MNCRFRTLFIIYCTLFSPLPKWHLTKTNQPFRFESKINETGYTHIDIDINLTDMNHNFTITNVLQNINPFDKYKFTINLPYCKIYVYNIQICIILGWSKNTYMDKFALCLNCVISIYDNITLFSYVILCYVKYNFYIK